MPSFNARPEPPLWAVSAGLPEPHDGEEYADYLVRLGLDPEEILAGLDDRTACLANYRLATKLMRSMNAVYKKHVDAWVAARLDPERRRCIALLASNLFPRERRARS